MVVVGRYVTTRVRVCVEIYTRLEWNAVSARGPTYSFKTFKVDILLCHPQWGQ